MKERIRRSPSSALLAALLPALTLFAGGAPPALADEEFRRGDVNTDGRLSLSDVLMLRRWLFNGDRPPACLDAADVSDNGQLDLTDAIELINYLFLHVDGATPAAPYLGTGTDPTADGLDCDAYEVVPPLETDDLVDIGDVQAVPGGFVEIPIYITNAEEVEAFQIAVEYDPNVFTPLGLTYEGTYYEDHRDEAAGYFQSARESDVDGVFIASFVPSLTELGFELEPSESVLVFRIRGKISPTAPAGELVLNPTNGPEGAGVGPEALRNELTHRGDARYIAVVPETLPGILAIVPDLAIFRRGDSNGDGAVNISDPQFTLNALFTGGDPISCMDAADANDDGEVNISDPIATLEFLFLGRASLPPPHSSAGPDPTIDALECE